MNWPARKSTINLLPPKDSLATAQAIEMLKRTVSGLETGIFRNTRIGSPLIPALAAFRQSNKGAAAAWEKLSMVAACHWNRLDEVSLLAFQTQFLHVNKMLEAAADVPVADRLALRRELHEFGVSLARVTDEEAEALARARGNRAPPRRARAGADLASIDEQVAQALRDLQQHAAVARTLGKAALVQKAFMKHMRQFETTGTVLSGTDRMLLGAYKKFSKQVESSSEAGWTLAWDFLTGEGKGAPSPEAIKAEIREFDRLAEAFAKNQSPDTQINLFKAMEAQRKSPIHSSLKGKILGEVFAQHWGDWKLFMDVYAELAEDVAKALGPGWEVRKVCRNLRLGSKEYLDQAILLVNKKLASDGVSSAPLAKLFMGVQIKVESVNTSLEQTLNDMVREAGNSVLEIENIDGPKEFFRLVPSLPGEKAHRWVLNAAESDFPDSALRKIIESRVILHQQAMPMTLEEFNLLAHALMRAAADAL